jgi:hypothetical protein
MPQLRPPSPLRSTLALLPLLAVLAGCDAESTGGGSGGSTSTSSGPDLCADLREECFGAQSICVVTDGAPACQACPAAHYATREDTCEPLPGTPLTHEFAEFTVQSGEEVLGLCQSWTLNNAEELWVNAVVLEQDESSHHSNWTFVPDDKFTGEDGVWPCKDRGYSQLQAALFGGVIYAQSTQTEYEVQKFPNGAAVRIPPYSRIIGDVHLLNTTDADITGNVTLSLYSLPAADVTIKLAPFHLTYDGLSIPPQADSRFTGRCELDSKFGAGGFEMDIYYILPHYHARGKSFFLDVLGGKNDGERIFEVGAYDGESHGKYYDPPYSITDADGLGFGCDFNNPTSETIKWGFGDQEMCETLGFAASEYAFESRVETAEPEGTDGSTQLFTGACSTLAFKWAQDKPGGPGPQ